MDLKRMPLFPAGTISWKEKEMLNKEMAERAADNLRQIREKRPLIHNISNFVVMNFTANALLACGASPVMAHAPEEVEEMVSLAGALVLNIGTLTREWIETMLKAGRKANEMNVPIVLDPVGSGATQLRTHSAKRLIDELEINVVRGNASEVLSLSEEGSLTKGVDALHSVEEVAETALHLSQKLGTTLAITGKEDLITDGKRVCRVMNGHQLMGYVTGTGCTATAIMGAFLAVCADSTAAATTSLAYFGLAGERAAGSATGPGSFQVALLDALYDMDLDAMKEEIAISVNGG
jgi:hydroxyethylthiazole kinase